VEKPIGFEERRLKGLARLSRIEETAKGLKGGNVIIRQDHCKDMLDLKKIYNELPGQRHTFMDESTRHTDRLTTFGVVFIEDKDLIDFNRISKINEHRFANE